MFKYLALLSFIALFLVGCVSATPSDPYTLQGIVNGQIRGTEQARLLQAQSATLEAARIQEKAQAEIDVLNAKLGATQTAFAIVGAQATATVSAQQYQYAQEQQNLKSTLQAQSVQATQTAVSIDMVARQEQAQRKQTIEDIKTGFTPFAYLAIFVMFMVGLWKAFTFFITRADRKSSLFETRYGTVVFELDEYGVPRPRLLAETRAYPAINKPRVYDDYNEESQAERVTQSGSVLLSPPDSKVQDNTTAGLTLRMVRQAIEVAGENSNIFPGWRNLPNCNPDLWERVTNALSAANAIEKRERSRTVLRGYSSLVELERALETHTLKIRPVASPSPSSAYAD